MATLLNRTVRLADGRRTSARLEDAFWSALDDIQAREHATAGDLIARFTAGEPNGSRTSAIRVGILRYYADALRACESRQSQPR